MCEIKPKLKDWLENAPAKRTTKHMKKPKAPAKKPAVKKPKPATQQLDLSDRKKVPVPDYEA